MIPHTHHQTVFAPPGTLRVYPQQAIITGENNIIGSLKIFIKARLGAGLQESVVDTKNDRHPTWTQELGFRRKEETSVKFEFYHKNFLLGPSYIGECVINLDPVFIQGQVTVKTDVVHKCHRIGSFQARFKWEPDGGQSSTQARPVSAQSHLPPSMSHPLVFTGQNLGAPEPQTYVIPVQPQIYGAQPQVYVVRPPTAHQGPVNVNFGPGVQGFVAPPYQNHIQNPNPYSNPVFNANVQPLAPPREEAKIEEPAADPDLPEDKKCVICLDRKKAGAFYRCGHNCCCATCGHQFIGKPCPICRQIVADFIKVFDS